MRPKLPPLLALVALTLGACWPPGPPGHLALDRVRGEGRWALRVQVPSEGRALQALPLRAWLRAQGRLEGPGASEAWEEGAEGAGAWTFSFPRPEGAGPHRLRVRWQASSGAWREALGSLGLSGTAPPSVALRWVEAAEVAVPRLGEPLVLQALAGVLPMANTRSVAGFFESRQGRQLGLIRSWFTGGVIPSSAAAVPKITSTLNQVAWVRVDRSGEWVVEPFLSSTSGLADGPQGQAMFNGLADGVELPDGRLLLVDGGNHALRLASQGPQGWRVDTVLGNGRPGLADGLGQEARLTFPAAIEAGASGSFFVLDAGNRLLREAVEEGPGRWRLRTLAGGGAGSGADGVGTAASLAKPLDLAWDGSALWVLDGNGLVQSLRRLGPDLALRTWDRFKFSYTSLRWAQGQLWAVAWSQIDSWRLQGQGLSRKTELVTGQQVLVEGKAQPLDFSTATKLSPPWEGRMWLGSLDQSFVNWRIQDRQFEVLNQNPDRFDLPFGALGAGRLGQVWPSFRIATSLQAGTLGAVEGLLFDDGCCLVHWGSGRADLVRPGRQPEAITLPPYGETGGLQSLRAWGPQGLWAMGSNPQGVWLLADHHQAPSGWRRVAPRPPSAGLPPTPPASGPLEEFSPYFSGYLSTHSSSVWDPQRRRMLSASNSWPFLAAVDFEASRPAYELWAGAGNPLAPGDGASVEGPASTSALNARAMDLSPEGVVWSMDGASTLMSTREEEGGWRSRFELRTDPDTNLLDGRRFYPTALLAFSGERLVLYSGPIPGLYLARRDAAGRFRLKPILPEKSSWTSEGWTGGLGADALFGVFKKGERLFALTSHERGGVVEIKGWDALP